jgi:hypothetical protein
MMCEMWVGGGGKGGVCCVGVGLYVCVGVGLYVCVIYYVDLGRTVSGRSLYCTALVLMDLWIDKLKN